ncbi:MAG: hypothetical protein IMZ50_02250 [Candidatus Atribacteria bacterium]|nr:hypothetical protein [Candidatus Atribacteria bacterium]
MQQVNHVAADEADAQAHFKALPKEYRAKKGAAFFALVDRTLSPAQIDAAKDIPKAVKGPLKYFKEVGEQRRLEMIRILRNRARSLYANMGVEDLGEQISERNLPFTVKETRVPFESAFVNTATGEDATAAEVANAVAKNEVPDTWGIQWGHVLHTWFGQYELSYTDTEGNTHKIGCAETRAEAYAKLQAFRKKHPEIPIENLSARPGLVLPADVLRLSRNRYFALVAELENAADIEGREVLRGIVGRKEARQKYNPQLMHRWGKAGYSEDFQRVWFTETYQFWRWKYLNETNSAVQPMIENIRRKGMRRWADHLEATLQYIWGGGRSAWSESFDAKLSSIPVVGDYVRPFALDRMLSRVRGMQYFLKLQTGEFYVLNTLQMVQTLWPVAKEHGLWRGIRLYYSKEGQAILARHNVLASQGKLREERFVKAQGLSRYTPAGASEQRNQGVAFLALYDYGRNTLGLSDAEAAKYGRLRGQVFTQFAYVPANTPKAMRGPIGGTALQFKRFTIMQLEMVGRMMREGDFGGVGRWLAAQLLLGGLQVAFGAAKLAGWGYLGYELYKYLEKEYGEETADVVSWGLPALLGVDISGSVDPTQIIQVEDSVAGTIGSTLLGPTGSDIVRAAAVLADTKTATERTLLDRAESLVGQAAPTLRQADNLRRLLTTDTNRLDAKGRLQYRETWNTLWAGVFGFNPVAKSRERMMVDAAYSLTEFYDKVLDESAALYASGKEMDAMKRMEQWNGMFPEVLMTESDILRRLKGRQDWMEQTTAERRIQQTPKKVKEALGITEE